MNGWKKYRLDDFAKVIMGLSPSGDTYNKEQNGMPLLNGPTEFGDTHPNCTIYTTDSKRACKAKDLIFCVRGSTTGRMNWADKPYSLGRGVCSITGIDDLTTKFLKHLLTANLEGLLQISSGGTFPNLNKEDINGFTFRAPIGYRKIAKILSNYDDLIENNLKRIKLLEESARLTYEEWFLRFRIDGKKLEIDPETDLPFGWSKITVNDYVNTISKGPSLNYDLGDSKGVQVLNQSCIRNGEIELDKVLVAKELSDNKKSSYLKINDILINSMGQGTLGRVSKNVSIDTKMIIHNCITYLRAKDIYSQYMLFYFISSHQEYFESLAQGSTGQSTLKKELVSNLLITLPEDKFINKFDSIVSSIWNEIGTLKKQNQLLKEARDILLPRLMTNMIDTDDMDIAI